MREFYETSACGITIRADVVPMGSDYTICIYDEKNGHIGSTAVAAARPSRTGDGISATSSVINESGHKEEAIARDFAESLAIQKDCTVVCTCGIHIDAITQAQIQEVEDACRRLRDEILRGK